MNLHSDQGSSEERRGQFGFSVSIPPSLVRWLIIGALGGILFGGAWFSFDRNSGVADSCKKPGIAISHPVEGQEFQREPGGAVVTVIASYECVPEEEATWLSVKPPTGALFGIHEAPIVDAKHKLITSYAVLASDQGVYRICILRADYAGDLALIEVISQNPPIGITRLPAGVRTSRCVNVYLE